MATDGTVHVMAKTKQEGYLLRLHVLIVKDRTAVLRARFNQSIPPSKLHLRLQRLIGTISYAKDKSIISIKQYNLLYPKHSTPTSEDFDMFLLEYLLRNFCGLNSKSKWWSEQDNSKIPDTVISEEADIVRIRNERNKIRHSQKTSIDQTISGAKWDAIDKAILRLGTRCGMQSLPYNITIIRTKPIVSISKKKITFIRKTSDNDVNHYDETEYDDMIDEQYIYDQCDESEEECESFNDGQDYYNCDDEFHAYYDNIIDYDSEDELQEGYQEIIDEQDVYYCYDELKDDYKSFKDKPDDYERYDELQDDYVASKDKQDDYDYNEVQQEEYDDFIDGQDDYMYNSFDEVQSQIEEYEAFIDEREYEISCNEYDEYLEWEDYYDRFDEMQDGYESFNDESDEYDRYYLW